MLDQHVGRADVFKKDKDSCSAISVSKMNLRCNKVNRVALYSWFMFWEGRSSLASFRLEQKNIGLLKKIQHSLNLFLHSYIILGNTTEFRRICDLGHGEKEADSRCNPWEPVSLELDFALPVYVNWNSLNCFLTISRKQRSQHSASRMGIPGLWVSSANKTVILFPAFLLAANAPVC